MSNCTAGLIPGIDLTDPAKTELSNALFSDGVAFVTRREAGKGAEQRFAVGKFLSGFGEVGYDQPQTNLRLWSFPYETELATITAESITRPAGDFPKTVAASSNSTCSHQVHRFIFSKSRRKLCYKNQEQDLKNHKRFAIFIEQVSSCYNVQPISVYYV